MLHCMYIYLTKILTNSTKQSCKIKCMIVNLDKLSTILYSNFSINTCVHIFHKLKVSTEISKKMKFVFKSLKYISK